MGLLDALKTSFDTPLDTQSEMIEAMAPDTVWAGSASVDSGRRVTTGLLWHDGERVRFQSWTTDFVFEVPIESVRVDTETAAYRAIRIDHDEVQCRVDGIQPLRDTVGFVGELPACAELPDCDASRVESFLTAVV